MAVKLPLLTIFHLSLIPQFQLTRTNGTVRKILLSFLSTTLVNGTGKGPTDYTFK